MKKLMNVAIVGTIAFGLFSFTAIQNDWVVPAEYKTMKNPTDPGDEEAIEVGEELYMKHCKSCHGKEGLGDGPKAAEQKGDLGDFSSAEFQKQSDGVLFYKSKFGKDDMPDFSKKIPNDEDMWYIVDYMRTLGE
jgi:mono/diheme cytochrome c family protein